MERGLIWLPLLILIVGLTWTGWKEYQKVESYRFWAENFEQAKYDLYAVIGVKAGKLTWGKATSKGVVETETFNLADASEINLQLGDRKLEPENLPDSKGKETPQLAFLLSEKTILIPFTELDLAAKWQKYLTNLRVF